MATSHGTATSYARLAAAAALAAGSLAVLPAGAAEIPEGALDPTFDGGTISVAWEFEGAATAAAAVAGGKLLVAGSIDPDGTPRWAIAELTESGQLAAPWTQQFVPFDFSDEGSYEAGRVYDVGRDAEGRTIVVGAVSGESGSRSALARLLPGGGLDPAFSGNGLRVLPRGPLGWGGPQPQDARLLPDGGAIVVGRCTSCRTGDGETASAFLLKFLPTSALDTSFSSDGWFAFGINALESIQGAAVGVDAQGRFVVALSRSAGEEAATAVARVLANGTLDPSFGGGDGISPWVEQDYGVPTDVAIDPESGRILMSRIHSSGFHDGSVLAFTGAGALDLDFGVNGIRGLFGYGSTVDVEIRSDGRAVTAGTLQMGEFLAARLTTAGDLDPLFAGTGSTNFPILDLQDIAYAGALWGGRPVLVGSAAVSGFGTTFGIARLHSSLIFRDGFERGTTGGWTGL